MVVDAGGPDDRAQISQIVRFPYKKSEESIIRIEGNETIVEKVVASIEAFVQQKENSTTDTIEISPEKHRRLIGRGGETRKAIESQFNVSLDIPRGDSGKTGIKIAGLRSDVDKAKEHILSLVTDTNGETIPVPKHVHHQIADNGRFFRRLRNDVQVTVDHGGQQPPPRPKPAELRNRPNGTNMPLITDEGDSGDKFSWQVVHNEPPTGDQENIPWNLSGDAANVAKARELVEAALASALKPSSTGYLILPDPKTYRFVVGPGGSHINAMRKKTGCQIQVPREVGKGEAIEITGPKDGVEQAKDLILEAVENGQNNGGRADGLQKAGKSLLNKMTRSESSSEKEMFVEAPYILRVINLPLVQQTRRTRISKKLELSKDKTEFWIPALPWRCIE
jgi:rRNA processing protein Krr1/Pno1